MSFVRHNPFPYPNYDDFTKAQCGICGNQILEWLESLPPVAVCKRCGPLKREEFEPSQDQFGTGPG